MAVGHHIPDLDNVLELAWATDDDAAGSSNPAATEAVKHPGSKRDAVSTFGGKQQVTATPGLAALDGGTIEAEQETGGGEVDYDVADENDWISR